MILKIIYETPNDEEETSMGLIIHNTVSQIYPKCKIIIEGSHKTDKCEGKDAN